MTAAWKINKTVGGVLALFVFIYTTVLLSVIVPWLSYSVPGVSNWLVLTTNTVVAFGCFVACILADPGSVPQGWSPSVEENSAVVEVKRKGGENRFCQKCKCHKPPRSHHCRICKRCILRMDHHCPWINNCVGHANYKAFLLFLIYVNAAVLHAMGLLLAYAAHMFGSHSDHQKHPLRSGPDGIILDATSTPHTKTGVFWATMQALCTAVTVPLALALAMLLCWNVYLVVTNRTTIEYYEGVTARIQATRRGQHYQHPYDLGLCGNLHTIFGPDAGGWLVPGLPAFGDGLAYVTAWDHVRDDVDSLLGF